MRNPEEYRKKRNNDLLLKFFLVGVTPTIAGLGLLTYLWKAWRKARMRPRPENFGQ